jgi:hypothetical protein
MRQLLGLALAATLAGCGLTRPAITDLTQLAPDEVLIVGSVKLTPPLDEQDQRDSWNVVVPGGYKNKVRMLTGEQWRQLSPPLTMDDYRNNIQLDLGATGFASMPRQSFYILLGAILMDDANPNDVAYLPGGFKVGVRDDDRAIYIGTLHYHRDEFFKIKRVRVEDDFDRAAADFRKQFGKGVKLRKSLAKPTNS